jgi:hypothetical protein
MSAYRNMALYNSFADMFTNLSCCTAHKGVQTINEAIQADQMSIQTACSLASSSNTYQSTGRQTITRSFTYS